MRWLLLGAKEYPFGAGADDDALPSGGYEKYAEQLADALAQAGHEVHIVTRRFKKPAKNNPKNDRIRVHTVRWISGKLLRNPSFNTAAMIKAASLDYDVVLAQGVMATLAALALKKIRKRPVISIPAGVAYSQPQHGNVISGVVWKLEKTAYSHADAVVFLSPEEKAQFQTKLGFLPRRIDVIAPGVAMPEKSHGKKNKSKSKPLRLLFVGRLIGVKGVEVLLHAMVHSKAQLTIVGSGPDEEKLNNLAKKLELKNVWFAGFQPDPSAFYQKADAFVLPSFSEGLPLAALEAASFGLALIVTDIGLPFVNGKTALVVPPKNTTALAQAIRKLENDPTLTRQFGNDARQFVEKNYSWEKTVNELEKIAAKITSGQ